MLTLKHLGRKLEMFPKTLCKKIQHGEENRTAQRLTEINRAYLMPIACDKNVFFQPGTTKQNLATGIY